MLIMKKILFVMLILNSIILRGQELESKLRFGISYGFSTFNHEDLRKMNQTTIEGLPFKAKILDEFEPNFNFGGYSQYNLFNNFWIGPDYHYYYTGSRIGLKDYSGEFSFDQYLKTHALGVKMDFVLTEIDRLKFLLQINSGGSFSKWEIDSKLSIGDESEIQTNNFKGFSWYAQPSIVVNYKVNDYFLLVASAGYSIDLTKKYKYEANRDVEVTTNPNWSGIRLALGIEFEL